MYIFLTSQKVVLIDMFYPTLYIQTLLILIFVYYKLQNRMENPKTPK